MKIKDKIKLNKVTHTVRASQAVLQYGVGAMVDFPEQTLMTAAPETWDTSVMEIHDERLENKFKVDYFGMPGSGDEGKYQNGVSYTRFPEWYFCPKCRHFKPLKQWIDDYTKSPKTKKIREKDPEMIRRLRCSTCFQDLVVARIVVACPHGHIDDFPWIKWVHAKNFSGPKKVCSNPSLKFTTSASSTEGLEGLTVSCLSCNCRTTLKGAFDKDALKRIDEETGGEYNLSCAGRHPWKNSKESCKEYPHVLQRGSSSVYFPITYSSLVIPPYSSKLTEMVQNSTGYSDLTKAIAATIKNASLIPGVVITQEVKDSIVKQSISEYANKISLEIGRKEEQIRAILERKWNGKANDQYTESSIKYKAEEYAALSGEVTLDSNDGEFIREATSIDDYQIPHIKNISLIHKVREVQALIGFSRLEPVDKENLSADNKITPVNIKDDGTKWYPGYEIRGEGIFIELDDDAIDAWRSCNSDVRDRVNLLNENYKKSYYGSIKERTITEKYLLLHTLSHLLMKQLSFECGYSIASLKERIYCSEPSQGRSMSGIFIYTASGDSEGTMGGLVRQGRPDVFPGIFKKAIEASITCSNDPVCSLSLGQGRDSLNLSACYSCTLVPETSCEEFNVFLDRGVIIGTFEKPEIGFYSSYLGKRNSWSKPPISTSQKSSNPKNTATTNVCVIKDPGMDLSGMSYKDIWNGILQFSDDSYEKELLETLMKNEEAFVGLEKPRKNATFNVAEQHNLNVDLMWPASKVLLFSTDSKEEYLAALGGDWMCFYTGDSKLTWNEIKTSIKEK